MLLESHSVARRQLAALRRQAAALEQLPVAVGAALRAFTAHLDALLTAPAPTCASSQMPSPVPSDTNVLEPELDTSELESYTVIIC
ncbi:hypothetical protein EVAR_59842_1 [Eumeta japonica]|uniref:Uncharacterized protein n=1 Tax=Eumeta variegata TaxID=151549 RepID=A0A4C1Z3I8_EUMVA|nr:hypothetical protein EVAR_59842_1 [Eumeta japonica]